MKEYLGADRGPRECIGTYQVEIKQGKRRDQEILPIQIAEVYGPNPLSPQRQGSDQHHANQQKHRQCC